MASLLEQRKVLLVAFLLAMTFCNLVLPLQLVSKLQNGYQDFTIFYTGARILRSGQASTLYNLSAQYRMQQTFTNVPIRLGPLPFNHPPFEALLFEPFTLLDYWPAYLSWTALNLLMLAASMALLRKHFPQFAAIPPLLMTVGATAFFPIAIGIIQGQDIILLLLLFVLAMICLDRGHDELAGALLGLGLFRPQSVVPLALFLAIRRWRVLLGFVPVALFLGGITVALLGWHGPVDYVRFVLHLEGTDARAFGPEAVPNLRGLVSQLLPVLSATGPWVHLLILASSLIVFLMAARRIRDGNDSLFFASSLAAIATILIGFHSLVYDFTLLFPMVLILLARVAGVDGRKVDIPTNLVVGLLFLTPVYVLLLLVIDRFVVFSLVLLWLFVRLLSTPAPAEVPS